MDHRSLLVGGNNRKKPNADNFFFFLFERKLKKVLEVSLSQMLSVSVEVQLQSSRRQ